MSMSNTDEEASAIMNVELRKRKVKSVELTY